MSNFRIPVTYLAQIEDYLTAQGFDSQSWLLAKGLNHLELKKPLKTINYDDYAALIKMAVKLDGHQDVGLRIGQHLRINQHGALGFALLSSGSVKESLYLLARYIKTRTPLIDVTVAKTHEHMSLLFRELCDFSAIRVWFLEALVVSLCNIFRFISPDRDVINVIKMPFTTPVYSEHYRNYIPFKVEFGHDSLEIEFSSDAMTLLLNGDNVALEQAKTLCESEIKQWDKSKTVAEQVRAILSADCNASLLQVANKLHVTARTLHRKLQKESCSFHQLQEEQKHVMARQYLRDNYSSVKQVAYALGYSDVANFRRAFKRWEGCAPVTYRNQALKQGN